jgi:hypothetical protein
MFNNAPLVMAVANDLDPPSSPEPRRRVTSEPCLPERLPSTGLFEFEILIMETNIFSRLYTT